MTTSDYKYVCVDLFAGIGGFSAAAARHPDWRVITVDKDIWYNHELALDRWGFSTMTVDTTFPHDIVGDVAGLTPQDFPDDIDLVVASPPCDTFSLASISAHRDSDGAPITEKAAAHDQLLYELYNLLEALDPTHYVVENPRALMRTRPPFGTPTCTITQCQYGAAVQKPTDLWHTLPDTFTPKQCDRGDECHEPAPRGSSTGTQGQATSAERAKIPYGLSRAIRDSITAAESSGVEQRRLFDNFDDESGPSTSAPYCEGCKSAQYGDGLTCSDCNNLTPGWGHPLRAGCPNCTRLHTDHSDPTRPCDICAMAHNASADDVPHSYSDWIDVPCRTAVPPTAVVILQGVLRYVPEGYELVRLPPEEEIHSTHDGSTCIYRFTAGFLCPDCDSIHRAVSVTEPAPYAPTQYETLSASTIPEWHSGRPPVTVAERADPNPSPTLQTLSTDPA